MTQVCKVCLAQHDEEIHAATNRVHRWFRVHVTEFLDGVAHDPMPSLGEEVGAPELNAA